MKSLLPYWNQSRNRDIFDEMDRFFEALSSNPVSHLTTERSFIPAAEVMEEKDHFFLSFDLPGFKKEDINIEVADNILTLSGERKKSSQENGNSWRRAEKSYGTFSRSFQLPQTVSIENIEANYEDGVLSLYVPKTPAIEAKKIEIQSKKSGIFEKLLNPSTSKTTTPSQH